MIQCLEDSLVDLEQSQFSRSLLNDNEYFEWIQKAMVSIKESIFDTSLNFQQTTKIPHKEESIIQVEILCCKYSTTIHKVVFKNSFTRNLDWKIHLINIDCILDLKLMFAEITRLLK